MVNETKFSQPPYNNDIAEIDIGESITIFVGDGAAPIAIVNNYDDFPCADEDQLEQINAEARATARLFTAAPDLLGACQAIDSWWSSGNFSRAPELWAQLRRAIAKSQGVEEVGDGK